MFTKVYVEDCYLCKLRIAMFTNVFYVNMECIVKQALI